MIRRAAARREIAPEDLALEPRLAGLEHDPVFLRLPRQGMWGVVREDLSGNMFLFQIALFLAMHDAVRGARGGVWGFLAGLVQGLVEMSPLLVLVFGGFYLRARPDCTLLGRPLGWWAQLADAGYPARDVARGVWGVRVAESRLRARRSALLVALLGITSFLISIPDGVNPLRRDQLAAACTICLAISGYILALRERNPWSAAGFARASLRRRCFAAFGGRGRFVRASFAPDTPASATPETPATTPTDVVDTLVPVVLGIWLFAFSLLPLLVLAGALVLFDLPGARWILVLAGAPYGWMMGRAEARGAKEEFDAEFEHLVVEARRLLNGVRVRVHGPDAVTEAESGVEDRGAPSADAGSEASEAGGEKAA